MLEERPKSTTKQTEWMSLLLLKPLDGMDRTLWLYNLLPLFWVVTVPMIFTTLLQPLDTELTPNVLFKK